MFYGVNATRCGAVKFLTQMSFPELAPFVCRGDFYIQKYLPQGIEFKRTQVIAEGGDYCDFRSYDMHVITSQTNKLVNIEFVG